MTTKYDANVIGCSGLFAGNIYGWQAGLRFTVAQTAAIWGVPATMITPMNGYAGWEKFAESIIRRKPKRVILDVHSNGGILATNIALTCWQARCPTEIVIVMFDRTLGRCPAMESNVVGALDMHVNKSWLNKGRTFKGLYEPHDFGGKTSHIGVTDYAPAKRLALEFAARFKP